MGGGIGREAVLGGAVLGGAVLGGTTVQLHACVSSTRINRDHWLMLSQHRNELSANYPGLKNCRIFCNMRFSKL